MKRKEACSDSHPLYPPPASKRVAIGDYLPIALSSLEEKEKENENSPSMSSSTAIITLESLPVEVLARIVQALPWRDKIRIERVSPFWRELALTRGWTNVRHFSEFRSEFYKDKHLKRQLLQRRTSLKGDKNESGDRYDDGDEGGGVEDESDGDGDYEADGNTTWRKPLLARMGSRLTSIELYRRWQLPNCGELIRADLEECPNLKHLSLCIMNVDATTFEYIGRNYPKLKSLHMEYSTPGVNGSEEEWSALNKMLGTLSSLEFLEVYEEEDIQQLRLSPDSLVKLRHLSLTLPINDCQNVLASLHSLSSLTLSQIELPIVADFSFLGQLSRLEHLELWLHASSLGSFTRVMPHLGGKLRALEVTMAEDMAASKKESLIWAIATHLPKLEHLGISEGRNKDYESSEEQINRCFQPLAKLPLRSLDFRSCDQPLTSDGEWRWLHGLHHLEYLNVELGLLPLGTVTTLIRNHKKLSYLYWADYKPSMENKVALVEAANARLIIAVGEKTGVGRLTPISVGTSRLQVNNDATDNCEPSAGFEGKESSEIDAEFRMRFTEEWRPNSFVLRRYKYGCLSEGKPPFIL